MSDGREQAGQVVIILLLVMVLALAIALSVIGRSVTEVSTANRTEESSRAFSAAEAGIEKLIQWDPVGIGTTGPIPFSNESQAEKLEWYPGLPKAQTALEKLPFDKDSFAQFWLADPVTLAAFYNPDPDKFNLYFGDPAPNGDPNYYVANQKEKPAVEVAVIYESQGGYLNKSFFFDASSARQAGNQFGACANSPASTLTNNNSSPTQFLCKVVISGFKALPADIPMMVRVRLLYSSLSHPVALEPVLGGSLPPQTAIYRSTGTSGNVQRRIQVEQNKLVMPQMFDYALFAAGTLSK